MNFIFFIFSDRIFLQSHRNEVLDLVEDVQLSVAVLEDVLEGSTLGLLTAGELPRNGVVRVDGELIGEHLVLGQGAETQLHTDLALQAVV